jgi:hypothetical protein
MNAGRPAGKNNALRPHVFYFTKRFGAGMDFAKDLRFTNPSGDVLCVLRSKIENEYFLFVQRVGHQA